VIKRLLDRLFTLEEINGGERCPTYLYRWTLFQPRWKRLKGIGVYLHHFVGDDWSRDLHDHPKRFVSIGLKGGYLEETMRSDSFSTATRFRHYRAPWIRTFPATHIHRLSLINKQPCWTLVIVLRTVRQWGFWHLGQWIPWRQYVDSETATQMKSCPD
jgi:hypothetical protein